MIQQAISRTFWRDVLDGVHQPNDQYRLALYKGTAVLTADTPTYMTDGEVIGAPGYHAGGQPLTSRQVTLDDDGVTSLGWSDPVWPRATITARAALIYNASKQNRAIAVLDLGQDYTSTNGDFTVHLDPQGVIRI